MYKLDIYRFRSSTEYEYKYKGNYGAKGEKRNKKQKRTPEDIARQNQYQKARTVRHLIKQNFSEGDYWITLTYAKQEEGRSIRSIAKDVSNFLSRLRREYKRQEVLCKYIYRIEIGSRGGIHVHMILNRITDLDIILQNKWVHGRVHNELLDNGTYEKLADYIVKPPTDQQKKLLRSIADSEDAKKLIRYSCSRNLERPEPETHIYSQRTMRAVFNNDLVPTKGFFIDKDSIRRGINCFTGMSYLHYQEIKLTKEVDAEPVRICECPICHQFTIDMIRCDCQWKKGKKGSGRGKIRSKHVH